MQAKNTCKKKLNIEKVLINTQKNIKKFKMIVRLIQFI